MQTFSVFGCDNTEIAAYQWFRRFKLVFGSDRKLIDPSLCVVQETLLAQRKHHSELKLQRDKLNKEEDTRKSGIKWKIINYQLQSWRSTVPTGQ